MSPLEILTVICASFLLQVASSHGVDDGCASLTCPSKRTHVCSISTGPAYREKIVSKNNRCIDQVESHENHDWRYKRGGNSHESGGNHGSSNGVFYTVSYNNAVRMLTVKVWNGCKITLLVCQGTPIMSTSKPKSTRGPFPPMIPSQGYPPSMRPCSASTTKGQPVFTLTTRHPTTAVLITKRPQETTSTIKPPQITTKSTTRVKTIIPTTKSVQVSKRSTKLPMVTTRTTKRFQTVAPTTKRPQVTTKTSIRTQSTWTTQTMHAVTPKTSRQPSTPTIKEHDVIKTTTKRQDIPSETLRPQTTHVPQPFPSGEPSDAEHVKQELRNHEDPQYGLMIGVPLGLVVITGLVVAIVCLCKRGPNFLKENKKTSELSKGLSIVYEEKGSSALPPSYDNPVYGKLMKGKSTGKNSSTSEKQRRERTMESSTERSHVSDRIYEEIQSVRLNIHGTMSSATSGSKSSKGTTISGEHLPSENVLRIPMSGYSDMKGAEYYYMSGHFPVKKIIQ